MKARGRFTSEFVCMYVEQGQVEVNELCPVMIVARDPLVLEVCKMWAIHGRRKGKKRGPSDSSGWAMTT